MNMANILYSCIFVVHNVSKILLIIQVKCFVYLLTGSNGHPTTALGNVCLGLRSGMDETGCVGGNTALTISF